MADGDLLLRPGDVVRIVPVTPRDRGVGIYRYNPLDVALRGASGRSSVPTPLPHLARDLGLGTLRPGAALAGALAFEAPAADRSMAVRWMPIKIGADAGSDSTVALPPPAPAPPVARVGHPSGRAGVVLRYHFVAGQTFAYRVTQTTRVRASGLGPARDGTRILTSSYTIRERVARVDAAGRASIVVARGPTLVRQTVDGRTTEGIAPAFVSRESVNADGSGMVTNTRGDYADAIQSGVALPPGPVAPGARWTVRTDGAILRGAGTEGAALPPIRGATHYLLVAVGRTDGQRVATIVGTDRTRYTARATLRDGRQVRVDATSTTQSRALFGLADGRVVAASTHIEAHLAAVFAATVQRATEDFTIDATVRPAAG